MEREAEELPLYPLYVVEPRVDSRLHRQPLSDDLGCLLEEGDIPLPFGDSRLVELDDGRPCFLQSKGLLVEEGGQLLEAGAEGRSVEGYEQVTKLIWELPVEVQAR